MSEDYTVNDYLFDRYFQDLLKRLLDALENEGKEKAIEILEQEIESLNNYKKE